MAQKLAAQLAAPISAHTSGPLFKFPSEKIIISYLAQHPDTNTEYNIQKINSAVAEIFAGQELNSLGIKLNLNATLLDLTEQLGLTDATLPSLKANMLKALVDFAPGKIFASQEG